MPNFIKPICSGLVFLPLMAISICSAAYANTSPIASNSPKDNIHPNIDHHLSESLYPDEANITEKIADIIELSIRKEYSTGIALRDAHPKAHGCVRAEFKVDEVLPKNLVQGVFIPGKTYQAWIRFSNGSKDAQQADIKKDARGMAIKLLAVPGEKLLDDETSTQDFIMINHPVFFVNDPVRYMSFMQDINSDRFFNKLHIPFALGAKGTWIALNTRNKISNPLQTRYWSMVPYQLGIGTDRQAIKLELVLIF